MQEKQSENDIQVKLKPILGLRPGVYLTIIYSVFLLFVLFLLLFLPGIRNPGAVLIVNTEPKGAAIRVNDVYMGVSDSRIPVSRGTHTIKAVMPGFSEKEAVHTIGARIFGSLFFPLKYKTDFLLEPIDPASAFALYAADYAAWTFAGEPTASWQVPMSLSEGAYRLGPHINNKQEIDELLLAASRFAVTRAALRDLIRAKILADNNGNAPSALTIMGSISDIASFLSEYPQNAVWLAELLPAETAAVIEASNWYHNSLTVMNDRIEHVTLDGRLFAGGMSFIGVSNSFYIGESPVSRTLFDTFLRQNPQWEDHYTDYYNEEIASSLIAMNRDFITGITWYAADAFCKWMTERLPASMANMIVRLPTEHEWTLASQGIVNMRNPGWEWCLDPYSPLSYISASWEVIEVMGSPERSLRGNPVIASTETRGSLPPDLSSPFVTFRPVITER